MRHTAHNPAATTPRSDTAGPSRGNHRETITWDARAARLHELRDAAAQVAMIGEYYHLRYRSALATCGGVLSGLAGTAAVVAAFAWP